MGVDCKGEYEVIRYAPPADLDDYFLGELVGMENQVSFSNIFWMFKVDTSPKGS